MMPEESGLEWLKKTRERIRKAFESKPEPEKPVSEETQKAIDKAIGPRFVDTRKRNEQPLKKAVPAAKPVVSKRRTKKGPTKY